MTTSLQTDPRRTARDAFRKPGRPPLEMPVLFQLADWSEQQVKAAPPSEPESATAAAAPMGEPVIAAQPAPIVELAAARVPREVEMPREETPAIDAAAVESPVLEAAKTERQPEVVISQAITPAASAVSVDMELRAEAPTPKTEEPSADVAATPTAVSQTSVTDVTPPTEATAPSPRERTEQRTKSRQPVSGNSNWMRTHGKYIAIAFVFALIATIYLAQNGDEPSPANSNAASSTTAEAEAKTPGESETKVTDAHAAKESVPIAHHNHSPSLLEETSPAAENPAAEAHAQLHAPKGGHTIKEPAQPTEVADSKSLFPWKEAGETRIASKPEEGKTKPQAESKLKGPDAEVREEAPAEEPPAEEAPSIYGPPTRQVVPANEQPTGEGRQPNGPSGYPTTDPNRFREFGPSPGRSATPASYQPGTQNTAPHPEPADPDMSALDQAFIKAYAKEPAAKNAAQSGDNEEAARASAVAERSLRAPLNHMANTQIENIYAAGTLYRIETPRAAEPAPVPPPHFGTRASRRMPLRYRLAQMEGEETAAPVVKRMPQPVVQPAAYAPQPIRKRKAQIPTPPALPPAPIVEIDEPHEEAVVNVAPVVEVKIPPVEVPVPILPLANAMEVRESWDELLGDAPVVANAALAVWPREEELAAAQASSLITLDLETMPEPLDLVTEFVQEQAIETGAPLTSPAKTYRLDAAHAPVPSPHQPPQPPQPTLEDLIKPAAEELPAKTPEAKLQDRPLVVSEEEAAELVGAAIHAHVIESAPAKPITPAPQHFQPMVPAWEVDRFLWPALCEKLLRDEQSYFAQAGSKIISAVRDGLKSLAITGSRRGEGRTTLALCLARSAAKAGLKVVLVDADFARPQLAAALGLEIAASWHEVALGKTSLAEVAIKSIDDNLTVLPLDVSTAAAPLSLADPRLTRTLRDAARSFDLLVLDLGPTSAGSDSLFPEDELPPADAAIVVRDLRYSTSAESQAIGERLSLSGIEAVGIAENFVPHEKLVA